MKEKKYILSDDELLELSDSAPMIEGGTLEDFLSEAEQVAEAVQKAKVSFFGLDLRGKALFYMRAFYFLGVLRGGEAYREELLLDDDINAEELPQVPFELFNSCAELFADDLRGKPSETLKAIYKAVGLGKQLKHLGNQCLTTTKSPCYNGKQNK